MSYEYNSTWQVSEHWRIGEDKVESGILKYLVKMRLPLPYKMKKSIYY